jgi:hypothetical protein
MATKVICIVAAAVVVVALMFLVDKVLPRKEGDESGDPNKD